MHLEIVIEEEKKRNRSAKALFLSITKLVFGVATYSKAASLR